MDGDNGSHGATKQQRTSFSCSPFRRRSVFRAVSSVLSVVVTLTALPPPNVLLITIDTVRADHLGAYGYAKAATPVIDRLAREGVRFDGRDDAGAADRTGARGAAHRRLPGAPRRSRQRDDTGTRCRRRPPPSWFKARGYRTGGFVGAFILTAPYGFAQGFDTFDADFPGFSDSAKLQVQRRGDAVVDAAVKWLDAGGTQPFFGWVHLYDAHAPYDPPPPFAARFKTSPYDGEIAYVDACIGRLIAALERSGTPRSHHRRGRRRSRREPRRARRAGAWRCFSTTACCGFRGSCGCRDGARGRRASPSRSAPSTCCRRSRRSPACRCRDVDGESVAGLIDGKTRRDPPSSYAETYYPKWHYGWSELKSIRGDRWKYIDAPEPEVYDLRADPAERRNVAADRGPLMCGHERRAGEDRDRLRRRGVGRRRRSPTPTRWRGLRSLGYVGMAASIQPSGARRRIRRT